MAIERLTNSSDESSFGDLLEARTIYAIPPFQRPYKWKPKHLHQLQEDLNRLIDGEEDAHFMGAVIMDQVAASSASKPSIHELIDGQQRMTTMYLLICASVRTLLRNKENETASAYASSYLFLVEGSTRARPRLLPSLPDQGDLNNVLDDLWNSGLQLELSHLSLAKLPTTEVNGGRISANYGELQKFTNQIFKLRGLEGIEEMLNKALRSITVVEIIVKDPTSGPKIFDSLNSRQEPMTTGDLVRNEIFSKTARQDPELAEELDLQKWQPFYSSFKRENLDTFEGFFFPYGLIKDPQFKKSEVYTGLRKSWENLTPTEVIAQLQDFSVEYQDLVFGENQGNLPKALSASVRRLHNMKFARAALPFLMQVTHSVKKEELSPQTAVSILSSVESFLMRRALCNIEPTGLHAVFKALWRRLDGEYTSEAVWEKFLEAKTVTVPSDEDVTRILRQEDKPFYGKSVDRFFLFEYNASFGGDVMDDAFSSLWIEHVLPQSYTKKYWPQFSEEEHNRLKDSVGNLLPLSEEMNRDVGQRSIEDKVAIYKVDSKFKSTREFAENRKSWTPEDIRSRTEIISKWAVKRWPSS